MDTILRTERLFHICGNGTTENSTTIEQVTIVLTITSCASSILGAVAIFGIYMKYPSLRTTSRKLLVFLSIADLMTASGNLVGIVRYMYTSCDHPRNEADALCLAQSFVTTYSSMSSFFWTAAISFFILMPVARRWLFGRRFHISCHLLCWIVPGIIVTVAACLQKLGEDRAHTSGGWCWISGNLEDTDRLTWMVVTGKGWEIAVYIVTAVNYILLKYLWYRRERAVPSPPNLIIHAKDEDTRYVLKKEDKNFLYVPVLLYALRLWGTVRFFLSLCQSEPSINISEKLQPLQGIGDSGQAFWNFIVFFILDSAVRSKICSSTSRDSELDYTVSDENTRLLRGTARS